MKHETKNQSSKGLSSEERIPPMYDPMDLANGSYGKHIEKYLGRSPIDGPPGYVFQKVTYSAGSAAGKSAVAGMYKLCPDHMGYIYNNSDSVMTIPTSAVDISIVVVVPTGNVDAGNNVIGASASLDIVVGDYVTYNAEGGATMGGLVDGKTYYVNYRNGATFAVSETTAGPSYATIDITSTGNSSQTFTFNGTVTSTAHGLIAGETVVYSSNGTAIGGLVDGTTYFVHFATANLFTLALTLAGRPILLTSTGNATQTFTHDGEIRINQDGADLASGNDPTPAGISGEAKLVPGDMILGSILQLIDTRSTENRTGFVTAGLVSNDSATPDSYGPELATDPSTFITGSAISGGKTHSAARLSALSVASPNLSIYSPTIVSTAVNDLAPASIGAPINAINVSGISSGQSNQIRFNLTIYALVGARQKTISHYTQPDPSFRMSCLTRQYAEHPVSLIN
uniref:Uncharacterized protein n=1 Tax=viral metagenome TaxID=1070528 RepID=A0A2V0RBF0_9ZZZZ